MLQQLQQAGLMGCYVDDIVVHSRTAAEHIQHVRQVLDMLVACSLKAHPEKSLFMTDTVEFSGSTSAVMDSHQPKPRSGHS